MRRIGWQWQSAFKVIDHEGTPMTWLETSTKALATKLRMAYQRRLEKSNTDKLGLEKPVYLDPARQLRRGKDLAKIEKGCLRSFLAKGIWANERLYQHGLTQDPNCPFLWQT